MKTFNFLSTGFDLSYFLYGLTDQRIAKIICNAIGLDII